MADVFSHPFRIGSGGAIATVRDGSDQALAEGIAIIVLTRPGERPLVPDFGLSDPAFDELRQAELIAQLDLYGPETTIASVTSSPASEGSVEVVIGYNGSEAADALT